MDVEICWSTIKGIDKFGLFLTIVLNFFLEIHCTMLQSKLINPWLNHVFRLHSKKIWHYNLIFLLFFSELGFLIFLKCTIIFCKMIGSLNIVLSFYIKNLTQKSSDTKCADFCFYPFKTSAASKIRPARCKRYNSKADIQVH